MCAFDCTAQDAIEDILAVIFLLHQKARALERESKGLGKEIRARAGRKKKKKIKKVRTL